MARILFFYVIFLLYTFGDSYKILVLFTHSGKSHFMIYVPFLQSLATKGHNLTVVSHYPLRDNLSNYRDVDLSEGPQNNSEFFSFGDLKPQSTFEWIEGCLILRKYTENNCRKVYEKESFKRFMKNRDEFDLILMQYFISDCVMGLTKTFNAPVIGESVN